jgi:hypothetical protein
MVEHKKTLIGGVMLALIILSSGVTYYVKEGETKTSCKKGWVLELIGDYTGQYSCTTSSSIRYETCFEVYNSSNTQNYWCKKGVMVEIPIIEKVPYLINEGAWLCNNKGCTPIK